MRGQVLQALCGKHTSLKTGEGFAVHKADNNKENDLEWII